MTNKNDEIIAAAVLWWANHLEKNSGEENIKKFMELLTKHLQQKATTTWSTLLGTNYSADWPLSEVCDNAKVSNWSFPQKTTMWINFDEGTVKYNTAHGASGQVYPVVDAGKEVLV